MLPSLLFNVALLIVSPGALVSAHLYRSPERLPKSTYDYIVVGAGTAGNVIAARLAEDGASVLVLEAGGSNKGVLASEVPFLAPSLAPNTPYDWNYTVTPQTHLDGRSFPYPRGRLLGGSSSINYMNHHYGAAADYDLFAKISGDPGWSWNKMKKYIKIHEKIVPPADGHHTAGQYTPSLHGFKGVLPKSLPGYSLSIDERVIATTKELSKEFPFNQDITSGNVLGVSWALSSIGGGRRSSSATTYLESVIGKKNVDVLVNAQVTKLLKTGTVDGKPSFKGVQFSTGPKSSLSVVHARKEIVLSAGAIGTPQILLLSGIGSKSDLASHSIASIIDNPSVGRNLSDHVLLCNNWLVNASDTLDSVLQSPAALDAALGEWQRDKRGPLVHGINNHIGFFRLPKKAPIFQEGPDPASGPTASHYEFIFSSYFLNPSLTAPTNGSYLTISLALISPSSRGTVKLASPDPLAHPLIDPQYLSTPFDRYALREAVKATQRFVAANAWKGYITGPYGPLASANTDEEIDAYVRRGSSTVFHPVGTASVSPKNARWGVVDAELRLKGAVGVRVVDASVWPFVPNAHTQGPVYLIAERAADLIRGS